jgi:zinc and cadmium transporter
MSTLGYILLYTSLGSIVSLMGGIILLANKELARRLTEPLSAFAAGALLGTAFLDLLPEALEASESTAISPHIVFFWVLIGIIIFFLLERFIHWFHHHHEHQGEIKKPTGTLILLGDSIHNFIDGVAIAITFMIDPTLGVVTTLAVGAHEIPQEIGDFGVLLKAGYSRTKVLFYNVLSAGAALVGATLTYLIGPQIAGSMPILLAVTAGFFIYIALSDLVPEIHAWGTKKLAIIESFLLIAGIVAVGLIVQLLEGGH